MRELDGTTPLATSETEAGARMVETILAQTALGGQGNPITYCATSPSLCVLEKLVHVEDPALLPKLTLVSCRMPDGIASESISLSDLPAHWQSQNYLTQQIGDEWLRNISAAIMVRALGDVADREFPRRERADRSCALGCAQNRNSSHAKFCPRCDAPIAGALTLTPNVKITGDLTRGGIGPT